MDSSVLDQSSQSSRMVGEGPVVSDGSSSSIGQLQITRSGQSVQFTPFDSSGNPIPVVSVCDSDDVQVVALVGVPSSSSLRFRFGNEISTPITLIPSPPVACFSWTATLPNVGNIDLAMNWGFCGRPPDGKACSQAVYHIYDDGNLIASVPLDQTPYPNEVIDLTVPGVGVFKTIGTFNLASTALEVRLCGEPNTGTLLAGMLRLAPTGSTVPELVKYVDPSPNRDGGSNGVVAGRSGFNLYGDWKLTFFFTQAGQWRGIYYAKPTGTVDTTYPALLDVQSALLGLPGIPKGSIQVSPLSERVFSVRFVGALSGQAQQTLLPSDDAFKVTHDGTFSSSIGGQYPSLTINGVDHHLKAASFAPGYPSVMFHLIQDAPDVQYLRFGEGLFMATSSFNVDYSTGFGGQVGLPTGPGTKGIWRFQGLPPATYELAITWPAGDSNGDRIDCIIRDGAGGILATVSELDQSQAPHDFQEGGVGWAKLGRFTLNDAVNRLSVAVASRGTDNRHCLLDSVRLVRVGPRRSVKIRPGDSVQFNAPAGFVVTHEGPLPAVNLLGVKPASPTRLPALPAKPKAMQLGINLDPPSYFGADSYYANLAVQALTPIGLVQDPRGFPTRLAYDVDLGQGAARTPLSRAPSDAGGRGKGVPGHRSGTWILEWKGLPDSECQLLPDAISTSIAEDKSRRVTGPINRRYYQVQDAFMNSPGVALGFLGSKRNPDSTYSCSVTDVAVYPPDVDSTTTPKWRSSFLEKLKGLQCIRFMDLFGSNDLNLSKFEHFPDPTNFPLGYSGRSIVIPIDSIGPPTPDLFAENVAGTVVRIKTRVPHGLATGFKIRIRSRDGASVGQIQGNVIDPRTNETTTIARDPIDLTDQHAGELQENLCHVIDETTLQVGINVGLGPLARMVNSLQPAAAYVSVDIAPRAMIAPSDAADLCSLTGLEPWINVPFLADDGCVTRLAQAFASRLPRGTRVHIEYGNEAWNSTFMGFFYCVWRGNLDGHPGISYVPAYVKRMGEVHQLFRDAWRTAGRDENEVRRVCGADYSNPSGTTGAITQEAIAQGYRFDEIATATYYSNTPLAGAADDLLTRDQLLDLMGANLTCSDSPAVLGAHRRALDFALTQNPTQAWIRDVEIVSYAGGPDIMTTATMTSNIASRNHGIHRHPEFAELALAHLQVLEDAGVKLLNINSLYGTRTLNQWGVYEGSQMQAGTGDPTIDVTNVDDFENLVAVKSETAAALRTWATLLVTKASRPAVVIQNGTLLTYGRSTAH